MTPHLKRARALLSSRSAPVGIENWMLVSVGIGLIVVGAQLPLTGFVAQGPLIGATGWGVCAVAWARLARIDPFTLRTAAPAVRSVFDTLVIAAGGIGLGWGLRLAAVWARPNAVGDIDTVAQAVAATTPLWAFIGFALAPAVGEELFFRGAPLRDLARRLGPARGAALSALGFASLHPQAPLEALVFGGALAVIQLATGRLAVVILIHASHNAIGLALSGAGRLPGELPSALHLGATACVVAASWILFARLRSQRIVEKPISPRGQKPKD